MSSPFNVNEQHNNVEGKIVVALERISAAFRVLLWNEGKQNSLSPVQIQILIFLLFHTEEKCKVSYLASEFNMTKATISDSIKVLLQKKLVARIDDVGDSRSFTLRLTTEGKKIAQKASSFANDIERPIKRFSKDQKEVLLGSLLKIIYDLNQSNVITIQRMCFTCVNYQYENGKHYCKLLQTKLADREIKIDCNEHEFVIGK